jgi:hypothetical protein
MTVYNITKLVKQDSIERLKQYLNTNTIEVFFTDWGYSFGIKAHKKEVNRHRHDRAVKYIHELLKNELIKNLTACPKVTR